MKTAQRILGVALLVAGASTAAMAISAAPEVDPGTAGSAIALVSGMFLLFRSRRK